MVQQLEKGLFELQCLLKSMPKCFVLQLYIVLHFGIFIYVNLICNFRFKLNYQHRFIPREQSLQIEPLTMNIFFRVRVKYVFEVK